MGKETYVSIVGGEHSSMLRIRFERDNRLIRVNGKQVRILSGRIQLQGKNGETRAIVHENGVLGGATVTKTDSKGVVEMRIPQDFYGKIRKEAEKLDEMQR